MFSPNDPELHDKILQSSVKGLAYRLHAERDNDGSFISPIRTILQVKPILFIPHKNSSLNTVQDHPQKAPVKCAKYGLWNTEEDYYFPLDCKKWTCEDCSGKLKRELERRIDKSEIPKWSNLSHIIITYGAFDTPPDVEQSCKDINKFLTYLKRGGSFTFKLHDGSIKTVKLPRRDNLKFFKMKEFQVERHEKTGLWFLHLHYAFNLYLTKFDIIPIWNKITGGFAYVEDRHPHNFHGGAYLMKYLTVMELQELFAKGERRYSCSKGLLTPRYINPNPSDVWVCIPIDAARDMLKNGIHITKTKKRLDTDTSKRKLTEYELLCMGFEVDPIPISELNACW